MQVELRSLEDLADETKAGRRAVRLKAGITAAWLGLGTQMKRLVAKSTCGVTWMVIKLGSLCSSEP